MAGKKTDRTSPPQEVPKHILFRSLLERPRPRWPLKFRVPCAPDIQLYAVALRGIEHAEALEANEGAEEAQGQADGEQLTVTAIAADLVARAVHTRRGRAFSGAAEVLMLRGDEVAVLGLDVLNALHRISPTYQQSNVDAWRMALKEGAQHPSNFHEALTMYRSCDRVGMNGVAYERPDRYFGMPMCEMTDGHLMAYSAAVELVNNMVKSPDG